MRQYQTKQVNITREGFLVSHVNNYIVRFAIRLSKKKAVGNNDILSEILSQIFPSVNTMYKITALISILYRCLAMRCDKPSIPSNSRIIYPRPDQVSYIHGTTVYLACNDGHFLTGSPMMVCNYTTWLKKEFNCVGMFFSLAC